MEYIQIGLFGENTKVVEKNNEYIIPKKLSIEDELLKKKLKILYDLNEQLYDTLNINILEQKEIIIINDLIVYPDERQAEPIKNIKLNLNEIDERIKNLKEVLNV